jgi:hypothetical protein
VARQIGPRHETAARPRRRRGDGGAKARRVARSCEQPRDVAPFHGWLKSHFLQRLHPPFLLRWVVALGADFVFIGRPFIYAASIGGQAGVAHAIRLLAHEIQQDMALIGVHSLRELGPGALAQSHPEYNGISR